MTGAAAMTERDKAEMVRALLDAASPAPVDDEHLIIERLGADESTASAGGVR